MNTRNSKNSAVKIDGGVAVITGAASGIGAGLARYAASRGMNLLLADWDADKLGHLAASLRGSAGGGSGGGGESGGAGGAGGGGGTEVIAMQTDVRDESQVNALADAVFAHFGGVDILFNNAGILVSGQSWEIERDIWQRSFDVNVGGVINAIRAFVPRLITFDRPSLIVNTASVGGFFPSPLMAPYSASKFALVALSEALAGELAALGSKVQVALFAPGAVRTSLMDEESPAVAAGLMSALRAMTERKGKTPSEIAPLVFKAIERGDYWIIPQAEALDDRLRKRTEMILARKHPVSRSGGHSGLLVAGQEGQDKAE